MWPFTSGRKLRRDWRRASKGLTRATNVAIYFGGESDAALDRVVRQGEGWYAYDITPEDLANRLDTLKSKMHDAGRPDKEIELIVGPNRNPVNDKTIAQYEALGVTQLVVPLFGATIEKLKSRASQFLG